MRKFLFWIAAFGAALSGLYGFLWFPTSEFLMSWVCSISFTAAAASLWLTDYFHKK